MKKNLKNKIALIIAVLLICLYGIFGIPSGVSGKALLSAISSRIHLGLDLQGGAHLILQVQVSEAVYAETDNSVQEIQQDLKKPTSLFLRYTNQILISRMSFASKAPPLRRTTPSTRCSTAQSTPMSTTFPAGLTTTGP